MTIVIGHGSAWAQITAQWELDTETGEIGRSRIAQAHPEPVCRFLARFAGQELEVALEATTGWRFVVEELRGGRRCVDLFEERGANAEVLEQLRLPRTSAWVWRAARRPTAGSGGVDDLAGDAEDLAEHLGAHAQTLLAPLCLRVGEPLLVGEHELRDLNAGADRRRVPWVSDRPSRAFSAFDGLSRVSARRAATGRAS